MNVVFAYSGPVTVAVLDPTPGSIADVQFPDDTFAGIAVCNVTDAYDQAVGEKIALGRAIIALGEALEKRGESESITQIQLTQNLARRFGLNILIEGSVTPEEFGEIAEVLDGIKSEIRVGFGE